MMAIESVIVHRVAGLTLSTPASYEGRRPLWAYLWPAGMVLADVVAGELAPWLRGRTVVELGCGLGAAGLAAGRAGADVTLTDAEPEALALASANARENGVAARTVLLDWSRVPESMVRSFDVVLASDVTYSPDLLSPLLGAIEALLARGGNAWIADPDRLSRSVLAASAGSAGLSVDLVRTIAEPPPLPTSDQSERRPVHVYRLTRGGANMAP